MENNIELIRKFFENIKCSQCDNFFTRDSVQPIRIEENNVVVKILCSLCGKNMGLAILGIDREEYKNSIKFHSDGETVEGTDLPDDPITYEEVAEAHKFFSSLGSDWMKFLPEKDKG